MDNNVKYKCPICGCEEFFTVEAVSSKSNIAALFEYDLEISGDAWITRHSFSTYFSNRICKSCGHVDLFKDPESLRQMVEAYENSVKEIKLEIEQIEKEIKELELQRENDEQKAVYLEEQLKSDEITVRQQNEFKEELKETKARLSTFDKKLRLSKDRLNEANKRKNLIPTPGVR